MQLALPANYMSTGRSMSILNGADQRCCFTGFLFMDANTLRDTLQYIEIPCRIRERAVCFSRLMMKASFDMCEFRLHFAHGLQSDTRTYFPDIDARSF